MAAGVSHYRRRGPLNLIVAAQSGPDRRGHFAGGPETPFTVLAQGALDHFAELRGHELGEDRAAKWPFELISQESLAIREGAETALGEQ